MKITAISDIHGSLLKNIESGDVMCICGDVFPQSIERDIEQSKEWFLNIFLKWIGNIKYNKVFLVPGNHDFFLEYIGDKINVFIEDKALSKKLILLCDKQVEFNGYIFYGTPWVTNLERWAFNTINPCEVYSKIPADCDILLTHHAPKIDTLGCSFPGTPNEKDFGSIELAESIRSLSGLKYHFCGHIHTGNHDGVRINNAVSYNVSIKDEQYNLCYKPRIIYI